MHGAFNKCKNCGRMKLSGCRCNICFYTDPGEHRPDDATCMCILCIPTPKEPERAEDADAPADPPATHHDLGGEAG